MGCCVTKKPRVVDLSRHIRQDPPQENIVSEPPVIRVIEVKTSVETNIIQVLPPL